MKKVAIVKAFMRPQIFKSCIAHLVASGADTILVAYDGPANLWDEHRQIVFEANQICDAEIFRFPYDYGLSACRNALIKLISEPVFLMLDDDILVPNNIWATIPIFKVDQYLAAATFGWFEEPLIYAIDAWDIEIKNNKILTKTIRWPKFKQIINGLIFIYPFDFVPNQGFWSRKFFDEFQWDEHYIIEAEHEDLALQAWPSKWKFAVCTNLFLLHLHDRSDIQYHNQRFSKEKMARSWLYFFHKWNLEAYHDNKCLFPYFSPNQLKILESVRESKNKYLSNGDS